MNKIKKIFSTDYFAEWALLPVAVCAGGFNEYISCAASVLIAALLIVRVIRSKQFSLRLNLSALAVGAILLGYLITCAYAIDKGAALEGFLSFMPAALYTLLLMQGKRDPAQTAESLEYLALGLGAVSFVLWLIPATAKYFSVAGRLAGFFQYPNSFALFLTVGLLCALSREKIRIWDAVIAAALGVLIFLTGSRAVMLIAAAAVAVTLFFRKGKKIKIIVGASVAVLAAAVLIAAPLLGSTEPFSRVFSFSFGESTLEVMETQPERVALIRGISNEKALDFASQLRANAGIRTLMLYLGEYGISNTAAVKVYNAFGAGCLEHIKSNPYILCQGDFGIPFERADFIAKRESLENDSDVRVRAGLSYILRHNEGNGHTCLPKEKLVETAAGFLGVDAGRAAGCLDEMTFDRSLIQDELGEREFIFTPQLHLNEMYIASRIKMLLSFPAEREERLEQAIEELERGNGIEYAELQRKAITGALSEGMLVLTGGPGTGKTTTREMRQKPFTACLKSAGTSRIIRYSIKMRRTS